MKTENNFLVHNKHNNQNKHNNPKNCCAKKHAEKPPERILTFLLMTSLQGKHLTKIGCPCPPIMYPPTGYLPIGSLMSTILLQQLPAQLEPQTPQEKEKEKEKEVHKKKGHEEGGRSFENSFFYLVNIFHTNRISQKMKINKK